MSNWPDYVFGRLCFSFACCFLIFAFVMAGEVLHSMTDGKIPRVIEWQSPPKPGAIPKNTGKGKKKTGDAAKEDRFRYWKP